MDLSTDQQRAYEALEKFVTAPRVPKQWFALQGLAGTGKTFLLARLARDHRCVRMTAYTGKAASVLQRRVGLRVSTLHSAIYNFRGLVDDEERGPNAKRPVFAPKGDSFDGHIIAVDEASMVGNRVAQDLLDTGARVIACGDPGQLPPVRDTQFFTTPDALLTDVHRQAWGSPIVRQAHRVRHEARYSEDGDEFRVIARPTEDDIVNADAILCWTNRTRRRGNARKRELLGLSGSLRAGEPVMCLLNDHELGLLNGAIYRIVDRDDVCLHLCDDFDGKEFFIDQATIEGEDPEFHKRRHDEEWLPFAPAYCATVHKFQGSECLSVLLYDEATRDWRSFMYTGITRAVERCTVVRYRS